MSTVSDWVSGLLQGIKGMFGGTAGAAPEVNKAENKPPAPPTPLSESRRSELRGLLASAGGFGGWWVGVAAAPTPHLLAFRELLADPQAAETARYLLDHGAPGGIAYGLCLLWLVDHPSFLVECPKFRDRADVVRLHWGGCLPGGDDVSLSSLISSPTAIKLQGPDDSIDAWIARNPGKNGGIDIEGGCYPRQLAER